MAYVYTWTQILNLLGSRDSDEIDDSSREAKAGFDERFRSILHDVEADPWKIKVPGLNVDGSYNIKITGPTGHLLNNLTLDASTGAVKPTAVSVGGVWTATIPVPRGTLVRSASFNVTRKTVGATVTCKIVSVDNSTGNAAPIPTIEASAGAAVNANIQAVASGTVDVEITASTDVLLQAEITADGADVLNSQLHSVDLICYPAGVTPP